MYAGKTGVIAMKKEKRNATYKTNPLSRDTDGDGVGDGYDINPSTDCKINITLTDYITLRNTIDLPFTSELSDPFVNIFIHGKNNLLLGEYYGINNYSANISQGNLNKYMLFNIPDNITQLINNNGVLITIECYDYEESENEYVYTVQYTLGGTTYTIKYNMTNGEVTITPEPPTNKIREQIVDWLKSHLGIDDLNKYKDSYIISNGTIYQRLDIDGVSNSEGDMSSILI